MFNWLKRLMTWLLPSDGDDSVLECQGQSWEACETRGVRLLCKTTDGIGIRLLRESDVSDRDKFWRCWKALNRADVRWDDGSEFAPLD